MKILYAGYDQRAAAMVARALHGTTQNVALTWARTPSSALELLQDNSDTTVVVIEVRSASCVSFVEKLRGIDPIIPVVVIAGSAQLDGALATLNAGADGYLVAGPSLEADLPRIVTLAVARGRTRGELHTRTLAELGAARDRAERQLARAEEARQEAERRSASELTAAAARVAELQAQHTSSQTREARICGALQERLFELERALRNADERRATEVVALADQLAKRHAEFTAALTHSTQSCSALAGRLSVATAALDEAQQARSADAAVASEQLRRREAEFGAALAEGAAARTALETALAEAKAAYREAIQLGEIDRAGANEREAALEDLLARNAAARTHLERKLAGAETAHQEARDRHAAELATGAAQLAEVQARYEAALEANTAERTAFERHAAEAASTFEGVRRAAAADAEQFARREAELGVQLAETDAAKSALESALTDMRAAHQETVRRAEADLAVAAERHAEIDSRLTREGDRAKSLEQQLAAAETARRDTDGLHSAEMAASATRFADLEARYDSAVTDHALACSALERKLAEAAAAREQADDRAATAADAATRREAELVERLRRESDARLALERDLASARADSARGRHRLLHLVSAHRRRGLEWKTRLDEQITVERAEADRERRAKREEIQQLQLEGETLRQLLGTTQDQLQHLHVTLDDERQAHEHARLTSASELQQLSADNVQLRQTFDRLQAAFQTLEQMAAEHVAERARLEGVVADRESELNSQAERHRSAEHAARDLVAQLEERLREERETSRSDMSRLLRETDALHRELDATRMHAEALRHAAERVPDLQGQLELSLKERRRDFERAPYGLCRCTNAGVITDANHTFVSLVGRRRADELSNLDFAAALFNCAGDLGWLLDRARATRKTEMVETEWRSRDGRQLVVRLQALAAATGSIEIVAEDVTDVRALEERLRRAQQMEAVGRMASEVAVTCDTMLRDIIRGANEWQAAPGHDAELRPEGGGVVSDARRVASLLRQLTVYGDQQARALEPVSAKRVLQDLAPVLKRVVGDQIELVMSKASGSFHVDVAAERLERVLVNVAGYARQRMPNGGQMRIDLATTAVGRRFVASHPHVRPGDHVLITVTELPGARQRRGTERSSESSDKLEVDLSALVELIGTCGGHLWMEAQPAGNMVVKIHLPKRGSAATTGSRGSDARSDRGGRLARWFRSPTATTNNRA